MAQYHSLNAAAKQNFEGRTSIVSIKSIRVHDVMDIKPGSPLYELLWRVDLWWFGFDGFLTDSQQLDFRDKERPLCSKEGLIKWVPSFIPLRDLKLKKIASEFGGWDAIMSPTFNPPEELYSKLEAIGYSRRQFDHSRRFIADDKAGLEAFKAKWSKSDT